MSNSVRTSGASRVVTTVPAKNPFKPRADEAERLARLRYMQRVATSLLGVSAIVFIVAAYFEPRWPWLGYVRAMAEASLVGGLADWFAVTALFRRPLGLPIPHTAIVATQKERIGRILGTFVQNYFLSHEVISTRLLATQPSRKLATWISNPDNAHRLAQQLSVGIVRMMETLPDERIREMVRDVLRTNIRDTPIAPVLGRTLSVVVAGNRHQELVNRAAQLAAQAVQDNRELIRDRVRAESPWWIPGAVDDKIYKKIFSAIDNLLKEIATKENHPVREAIDKAVMDFVWNLERSPETIVRMEKLKNEWLDDPTLTDLSGRLWDGAKRAALRSASANEGSEPGPLARGIASFGQALLANEQLLEEIDAWLVDVAVTVAEQNRQEVADMIAQTIASWDPDATVQRIEVAVGRDLQFVRINGTLVGGLVGLAIYTLHQIWRG
jgi:uncharacterized membrane-anchored protein YjiN (DUF445 family)